MRADLRRAYDAASALRFRDAPYWVSVLGDDGRPYSRWVPSNRDRERLYVVRERGIRRGVLNSQAIRAQGRREGRPE